MRLVERLKLFVGSDIEDLERQYAEWYDGVVEARAAVPVLKGTPFRIIERSMVIRQYEGDETYGIAAFFEDVLLEASEQGADRGGHLNTGVSLIPGKRR